MRPPRLGGASNHNKITEGLQNNAEDVRSDMYRGKWLGYNARSDLSRRGPRL
jgi:hypothetical protein